MTHRFSGTKNMTNAAVWMQTRLLGLPSVSAFAASGAHAAGGKCTMFGGQIAVHAAISAKIIWKNGTDPLPHDRLFYRERRHYRKQSSGRRDRTYRRIKAEKDTLP